MPHTVDYSKFVVPKPWGYEYVIYEGNNLSIWYLHIKNGASTSLHCHPNKKTGLVVLKGSAQISLIERDFELNEGQKIMIRQGAFHRTQALSNDGIHVLEVETPRDKEDLVRISDIYGRQNKEYESSKQERTNEFFIPESCTKKYQFLNYNFNIINDLSTNFNPKNNDLLVVLSECLFKHNNYPLCSTGEILTGNVFTKLIKDYKISNNAQVLKISQ
jgi:mannose-6-phosphate isomerase-like protein (cupin superfamily)